MKLRSTLLIIAPLLLLAAITWGIYDTFMDIATSSPLPAGTPSTGIAAPQDTIHVGVISRFSPNLIYEGYQPIMDYLSRECGQPFALLLGSSYEETISQLDRGQIQAAFLGTFLYLKARRSHPIRCILKPLNNQLQPYFHSVVVTRSDSPLRSVADLRGKRLALPSRLSFSGNWLLGYELQRHGLRPDDLDSIRYFGFHHTVIYQVLLGQFDAGAVKDRVAEEFAGKGIRILATSEPIPGSPIIIRRDLAPAITAAITTALLKIDVRQPPFRELIRSWDPEFAHGFAPAADRDYDQVEAVFGRIAEAP